VEVDDRDPLQQGLKPSASPAQQPPVLAVDDRDPLQQGLKHVMDHGTDLRCVQSTTVIHYNKD